MIYIALVDFDFNVLRIKNTSSLFGRFALRSSLNAYKSIQDMQIVVVHIVARLSKGTKPKMNLHISTDKILSIETTIHLK